MPQTLPPHILRAVAQELPAPAAWHTLDFISDLHLQASEPATFSAWQRYMESTPADAIFVLGDLFEVWVGDDAVHADPGGFEQRCASVIQRAATQRDVFFMHGNRDFLLGATFLADCGARFLPDPTVLDFAQQRWLLSHGDALCLDDVDYQNFRAEVRSPAWQQTFLARPLAERQAIARHLRAHSEARKQSGAVYADVDSQAARQWLQAAGATTLIHGHTHQPGEQALEDPSDATTRGFRRVVLSDWDAAAHPPRAQVLRLTPQGLQRLPLY
jgi:UDP-2,3-diacylglucosamine hydrolase